MSNDSRFHYEKIERPRGRPGYRPRTWCSVCGKTASLEADKRCQVADCPNICHIACLEEELDFNCEITGQLRGNQGITDPVTFYTERVNTEVIPPEVIITQDNEEEDADLHQLQKEELVDLVKKLRQELAATKTRLGRYKTVIDQLPEKRSILVEAISIIDTLVATQASIEEVQQRTIASSAYPNRIDQDWEKHIEGNDELYIWWTSEKIKKLKRTNEEGGNSVRTPQPQRQQNPPPQQGSRPKPNQYNQQPLRNNNLPPQKYNKKSYNRQGSRQGGNFNYKSRNENDQLMHTEGDTRRQYNSNNSRYSTGADRCSECNRQGHSLDQCPRRLHCDYCGRKYHTAQNCRERIADQRQQDLINAVQQSTQETLKAVQNFQLQHINTRPQQVTPVQHTGGYNQHNLIHPYFGNNPPYLFTQHNGWKHSGPQV